MWVWMAGRGVLGGGLSPELHGVVDEAHGHGLRGRERAGGDRGGTRRKDRERGEGKGERTEAEGSGGSMGLERGGIGALEGG